MQWVRGRGEGYCAVRLRSSWAFVPIDDRNIKIKLSFVSERQRKNKTLSNLKVGISL